MSKEKFVSWNVNGLRACVKKGFMDAFSEFDADIVAIQETKLKEGQIELILPGYHQYFNSAEKPGYSGTAVFTRKSPQNVYHDFDAADFAPEFMKKLPSFPEGFLNEGRILTLEFSEYYFINVYTPNARRELTRLDFRTEWEDSFREFLLILNSRKPVIVCGDLNVAHNEIDLKNPKSNRGNAGFTDEERGKMTELLSAGFIDSFRLLYPDVTDAYTWWSYMGRAREKNVGWRIDYFIVSETLAPHILESSIFPEITGSDHCPIGLELQKMANNGAKPNEE